MNIITNKNCLYTREHCQLIAFTVIAVVEVALRALAYQTTNIREILCSNFPLTWEVDCKFYPNEWGRYDCEIKGFVDLFSIMFLPLSCFMFFRYINGKRISNNFEQYEKSEINSKEKLDSMLTLALEHQNIHNSLDWYSNSIRCACLDNIKTISENPEEHNTVNSLWKKAMKLVETDIRKLSSPMCKIILNSTKFQSTFSGNPFACILEPGVNKNIFMLLDSKQLRSTRLVSKCFRDFIDSKLMLSQMIDYFLKMMNKCIRERYYSGNKRVAETLVAIIHKTIDTDVKRSKRMLELVNRILKALPFDDELVTGVKELELKLLTI